MDIYLLFNEAGLNDPLLSLSNIRRLPLGLVTTLAVKTTKAIKQRRNAEALAIANLGTLIHSLGQSFSEGEEKTQLSPRDFLPYPEEVPSPPPVLKPSTITTLRWLLKNHPIGKKIAGITHKYFS